MPKQSSFLDDRDEVVGVTPKSDLRYRKQYRFWLDLDDDTDRALAGHCEDLKEARLFAKTIRDGINLLIELHHGKVKLLIALFPWLPRYFAEAETRQMIEQMSATIIELRQELAATRASLALYAGSTNASPLPPPPPRPAPDKESDVSELLTVQAAQPSKNSSKWNVPYCNLQLGLYQLGSIKHLAELETQVLEYGLHVGKLPAAKVKPILVARAAKSQAKALPESGGERPNDAPPPPAVSGIPMDVPQFDNVQVDIDEIGDLF